MGCNLISSAGELETGMIVDFRSQAPGLREWANDIAEVWQGPILSLIVF